MKSARAAPQPGFAVAVVRGALVVVAEDFVGLGDLLERASASGAPLRSGWNSIASLR